MLYSSIFGDLTRNIQIRFDAVSRLNKRLFDNVLFDRFLTWDTPTIGLNFEELIGQYNITVAAPTIGDHSKEPIMSGEGFQTLSEKIIRHAITKSMTIQEYRKILQILDSRSLPDRQKTQQLIDLMWGEVRAPLESVLAKLDFIFLRALSNEGVFVLDEDTNPEGGARGSISFGQPPTNIADSKVAWTQGNITTVDVFEDIQGILDASADRVVFSRILCDPALITYMCRTSKIKQMIWGTDKSMRIVQLRDLNDYMQSNGFPVFEPIRRIIRIQNGPEKTPRKPWITPNMVFIPEGNLGVIKNAYANSELKPEPGVAYSNYGRVRISQWAVGETQNSNGVEFTKAEAFALPVITEFDGIYTLKTQYEAG